MVEACISSIYRDSYVPQGHYKKFTLHNHQITRDISIIFLDDSTGLEPTAVGLSGLVLNIIFHGLC
jgi:hypothetical protein